MMMLKHLLCLAVALPYLPEVLGLPEGEYFCSGGDRFGIIFERMTWNASRVSCMNLDAQLAILNSREKDKAVRKQILGDPMLKKAPGNGYWIGCDDQGCEGYFHWLDGSPFDGFYNNWYQDPRDKFNQPNDNHQLDRNGQDCCQMWKEPRKKPIFAWDDDYCWKRKGYVCQWVAHAACLP